MGDKVDDLLSLFGLLAEGRKKYKTVKEKFDSYFEPQRNVISSKLNLLNDGSSQEKPWKILSLPGRSTWIW